MKSGAIGLITGAIGGAVIGGTISGAGALIKGNNFWTGAPKAPGTNAFSFKNKLSNTNSNRTNYGTQSKSNSTSYSKNQGSVQANEHVKGINYGKQAKHIPQNHRVDGINYKGTQYIEGRSVLTANPEQILDDLHSLNYNFVNDVNGTVIQLNYNVGWEIPKGGNMFNLTNMVKIHGDSNGLIHFVPFVKR